MNQHFSGISDLRIGCIENGHRGAGSHTIPAKKKTLGRLFSCEHIRWFGHYAVKKRRFAGTLFAQI